MHSEWKACWFIKIAAPRKIQPISIQAIGEVAQISQFVERPADETTNNSEFLRCRSVVVRVETWGGIRDAFNVVEKELRRGLDWQASRTGALWTTLPQGTLPGEKVHSPVGHGCLLESISEAIDAISLCNENSETCFRGK